MPTIHGNTITLNLQYSPDGFNVLSFVASPDFPETNTLVVGSTGLHEFKIDWRCESDNTAADLVFTGDYVPVAVQAALPVTLTAVTDRHYKLKFDIDKVDGSPLTFTLGLISSISNLATVAASSPSATASSGSVQRPRPSELAAELGVKPSSPGAKLILLPTRKTSMPAHVEAPDNIRIRARP